MTNYPDYNAPQYQYQPPQTPQPPQKRSGASRKIVWTLGALVVVGAIGAALSPDSTDASATAEPSTAAATPLPVLENFTTQAAAPTTPAYVPPPAPPKPVVPATPPAWNKDGKYKIGKDIQPGEYAYTVKKGNGYWATCSDTVCAVGEGMIENDWIPTAGATGYLYIPADATMIELKDLRLEPTGG